MKVTAEITKPEFKPVTFNITCESIIELDSFLASINRTIENIDEDFDNIKDGSFPMRDSNIAYDIFHQLFNTYYKVTK